MYCVRRIALDTRLITHTGVGTYIRTVFGGLPQTRIAARRADMIVTDSAFRRHAIEHRLGITAERLAVVPAAVAPEFRPAADPAAVETFHRGLGIERYVLCVGRNKPHINLRRLI